MIKAVREMNGRPLLILGLSGENMTRLMADEPIKFDARQLGLDIEVLIVGGRTEDAILQQLRQVGLIGPDTQRRDG